MAHLTTIASFQTEIENLLPELSARLLAAEKQLGNSNYNNQSYVVSVSGTVSLDSQQLSLLAGAVDTNVKTYWSLPQDEFCFLAVGSAAAVEVSGTDRARRIQQLLQNYVVDSEFCDPVDVVWLGGLAFAEGNLGAPWKNWPNTQFTLPRILIRCSKGESPKVTLFGVASQETNAAEELQTIRHHLRDFRQSVEALAGRTPDRTKPIPAITISELKSEVAKSEWKASVRETAANIRDGKYEKVVLARLETIHSQTGRFELPETLQFLEQKYPEGHIFAFWQDAECFLGASPERLVSVQGEQVLVDCLAGTIGRGDTQAEDDALAQALLNSAKDRREHEVVRTWILHQLSHVDVDIGEASTLPTLKKLANVQHLHTPIRGQKGSELSLLDLVELLHPTPAVAGMPRDEALAVIRECERMERGWYAGAVGWMNGVGEGQFAVALRSALVRVNDAHLFAGAGIMGDSNPDYEWSETDMKLSTMRMALLQSQGV